MRNEEFLAVRPGGKIEQPMVDRGEMTLIRFDEETQTLIVYEAGMHYWRARGETSYAPAEYIVYRVEGSKPLKTGGVLFTVKKLATWPARHNADQREQIHKVMVERLSDWAELFDWEEEEA